MNKKLIAVSGGAVLVAAAVFLSGWHLTPTISEINAQLEDPPIKDPDNKVPVIIMDIDSNCASSTVVSVNDLDTFITDLNSEIKTLETKKVGYESLKKQIIDTP